MKVAIKNSDFKYAGERLKEGGEYDLDEAALAAIGEDNYEAVTDAKAEAPEKPDPNKGLRTNTGKGGKGSTKGGGKGGKKNAAEKEPPTEDGEGEGEGEGDPANPAGDGNKNPDEGGDE